MLTKDLLNCEICSCWKIFMHNTMDKLTAWLDWWYDCYPNLVPAWPASLKRVNSKYTMRSWFCGSWNCCKLRPIIGMIMNGLHIWAVKNCFIQLPIRIIGGSHKFDEIWGTIWVVLPHGCVPLKLKVLWSKEVCL